MKRSSMVAMMVGVVVVGGAPVPCALAQAPGQVMASPVTAAFLDKRVPEELATEGVVLSRQGLALQVEQVGAVWLASLVDLSTGRVAASTKLDALPADREAAVATMTQVVADLAAQAAGREPPAAADAAVKASDLADFAAHEETQRAARATAEASYRRYAIHFGTVVSSDGSDVSSSSVPYLGELDRELAPIEFFTTVHRPDLAAKYRTHRNAAITILAISGATMLAGAVVLASSGGLDSAPPASPPPTSCLLCNPEPAPPAQAPGLSSTTKIGLGLLIAGASVATLTLVIGAVTSPVDERQMKTLADDYNQHLRRQLGLPVVSQRAPVVRDLRLAPVVTGSGGGFALGGRF